MKKKAKNNSEEKLQNLAEKCTLLFAKSGVSAMDALLIVLNMLRYHSSLVMDDASHDAFMDGFKSLLQRTMLEPVAEQSSVTTATNPLSNDGYSPRNQKEQSMNHEQMERDKDNLGEALVSYIDPASPEFDAAFAVEIMAARPDWFTEEEKEAVRIATRHFRN